MIKIKNLAKNYNSHKVLQNISLEIKKGEVIAIIGASGCGKSTLLRCINGLEKHDHGEIEISGIKLIDSNLKKVRSKISMVFQNFNLFTNLNVIDNIALAPQIIHRKSQEEAYKIARKLLKSVGLEGKQYKMPSEISGGQKQRVAIARALAINPEVILFDEPTSALDPEMVKEVLELIQSFLSAGLTSLIVTHELKFAKKIADKILFLDKGKIEEFTDSKTFFAKPKSLRAQQFLENFED